MKVFVGKKILIISPEPWSHNFLSKHHYAITLAKANNEVYFLNPPAQYTRRSSTGIDNVTLVNYRPLFRGLNKLPRMLSDFFWKIEIRRLLRLAAVKFDIIWTFDPYRFQNLKLFKSNFIVYYAADVHKNKSLETVVANQADVVLAPSDLVLNGVQNHTRKARANHAVADYFFDVTPVLNTLPGSNKIKIGYVGNLDSKYLNLSLLLKTIEANPDCDFMLVGNYENALAVNFAQPNVFLLGPLANKDLPGLLSHMDVLLLCYDTEQFWEQASNSHKIMEYLSTGKVTVSTRIAEYISRPDLVVMPDKNVDLPLLLKKVKDQLHLYNAATQMKTRKDFALDHTYEKELERIDIILSETLRK